MKLYVEVTLMSLKKLWEIYCDCNFERAVDKHYFTEQQSYHPACGIEHAGMGAYHIEYDYPGNPDYPTVRAAIAAQNPPINN